MKKFSKEIKIALVAIVGIVILFFGLNFLKGLTMFSDDTDYYMEFTDISGLTASSAIYANGYQVGMVKSIDFDYTNQRPTRVLIGLNKNLVVPSDSYASIESDMMGNVKVNIALGHDVANPLPAGGVIKGQVAGGLMAQAANLVPVIQEMLPKLDSILTSVNTLLADPAIAATLHNTEATTASLKTSAQKLDLLLANVNRQLPTMMDNANKTMVNADQLTAKLAAVDVASTMQKVDQTIANVQAITDKINSDNGSLGLLMNDPSLYNNLNSTMTHADSLLINLREHPKRYVHFSLFGRKDK